MYRKEPLSIRSPYHKRGRTACSLRSSSFSRFFRLTSLISLTLFLFTTFYLKREGNDPLLQNNIEDGNEKIPPPTSLEAINFKDANKGHTLIELLGLDSTWKPNSHRKVPVTIVILHKNHNGDDDIGKQLSAILLSQSVKPKSVLIITPSAHQETLGLTLRENGYDDNPIIKIHVHDDEIIRPITYLRIIQQKVQTKYLLLLDSGVILGEEYLQNMLHISNTEEYHDRLLGTMGMNFDRSPKEDGDVDVSLTCYQDHLTTTSSSSSSSENHVARTTEPVDMLSNLWFLQKRWITTLFQRIDEKVTDDLLPLEFLIGVALKYHVDVPSILIPTFDSKSWGDTRSQSVQEIRCNDLKKELAGNRVWFNYLEREDLSIKSHQKKNRIVFILDGDHQESHFRSLYCKLSLNGDNLVKIIIMGKNFGSSKTILRKIIENEQSSCGTVDIYDLDIPNDLNAKSRIYQKLSSTKEYLKPDLIIYAKLLKGDQVNQAISSAIEGFKDDDRNVTIIQLPLEEIEHVTGLMTDLPFDALMKWHEPRIQIQVITQNRPDSLSRLIRSLNTSYYFGDDEVSLTINIDRGADPVTLEYCSRLVWNHGTKTLRHRVVQGGLLAAVVESYYPHNYDDYAVMLEDDIEVSPFYYLWIKYNLLKYRYGPDRIFTQRLFGISLYGQRQMELNMVGRRPYNPGKKFKGTKFPTRSPYLSQVPCSWGAVYFPEIWGEFHNYLIARLNDEANNRTNSIIVPNSRSHRWTKSWKRFLIELIYLRGYVMLYPNFKNFTSLSTNHAEVGIHMKLRKNKPDPFTIFGVPLMMENIIYKELPNHHLTDFNQLPVTDLWGNLTTFNELINLGIALHNEVSSCPPHFKNDLDKLNFNPKDILCSNNRTEQSVNDE